MKQILRVEMSQVKGYFEVGVEEFENGMFDYGYSFCFHRQANGEKVYRSVIPMEKTAYHKSEREAVLHGLKIMGEDILSNHYPTMAKKVASIIESMECVKRSVKEC